MPTRNALRNVVIVNDRAMPTGGASTVALESALALAALGYRVSLLVGGGEVWKELTAKGVHVLSLDQPEIADRAARFKMAGQAIWNRKAYIALNHLLRPFDPDRTVVHVHSWSKSLSPSVFRAASEAGFPLITTLHDYGFVCPNAGLHDFPTGSACLLKPMSARCIIRNCDSRHYAHKLWRVGRQIALEKVAKAHEVVDRALAVTAYAAHVYRPHLRPHLSVTVVPNPLAVEPCEAACPASNSNFLYVGRFSREKGVTIFAEAARQAGVDAVFVGAGELEGEIRASNPEARVTGWIPRDEVSSHIRQARAVVIPSTWRETQGMVVGEALANGVPPIVSSDTAPADAIVDGETGLVFENGSADSLAERIRCLSDEALVRRLGVAAHSAYWTGHVGATEHAAALVETYEEVLSDRAALQST